MPEKQAATKSSKKAQRIARKPAGRRTVYGSYRVKDVLGVSRPVTVGMVRSGLHPSVVGKLSKRLGLSTEQMLKIINLSKQTYTRRQTPAEPQADYRGTGSGVEQFIGRLEHGIST